MNSESSSATSNPSMEFIDVLADLVLTDPEPPDSDPSTLVPPGSICAETSLHAQLKSARDQIRRLVSLYGRLKRKHGNICAAHADALEGISHAHVGELAAERLLAREEIHALKTMLVDETEVLRSDLAATKQSLAASDASLDQMQKIVTDLRLQLASQHTNTPLLHKTAPVPGELLSSYRCSYK